MSGNTKFILKYLVPLNDNEFTIKYVISEMIGGGTEINKVECSKITFNPLLHFFDPFIKKEDGLIVLCDSYHFEDSKFIPIKTNYRPYSLNKIPDDYLIGCSQKFKFDKINEKIIEKICRMCLQCNLGIESIEEIDSIYTLKIKLQQGMKSIDELLVTNYLISRVCSEHDILVEFFMKSIEFSTKATRAKNNEEYQSQINAYTKKFKENDVKFYLDSTETLFIVDVSCDELMYKKLGEII